MEINRLGKSLVSPNELSSLKKSGKTAEGVTAAQSTLTDDSVVLSEHASLLRTLEEKMASAPAINQQRVDEIKQAIAQGRFKINADAIATALVNDVKALLGNQA